MSTAKRAFDAKMSGKKSWQAHSKPWLTANKPTREGTWLFLNLDMLDSPAWRASPAEVKLLVFRLLEEHHAHGGYENGNLISTYDDLESYGILRRHIRWSIRAAASLGFIAVVRGSAYGDIKRSSRYRLTFRPTADGALPTNDWKRFRSIPEAMSAIPLKRKNKPQCQSETMAVSL